MLNILHSDLIRPLRRPLYPIYDIRNSGTYENLFYCRNSAPRGGSGGLSLPFSLPSGHPQGFCSAADPFCMGYYTYYDPWFLYHLVYFDDLFEDFWRDVWNFEVTELGKLSWWGCYIYEGAVLPPQHQDAYIEDFRRLLKMLEDLCSFQLISTMRVWWNSNLDIKHVCMPSELMFCRYMQIPD